MRIYIKICVIVGLLYTAISCNTETKYYKDAVERAEWKSISEASENDGYHLINNKVYAFEAWLVDTADYNLFITRLSKGIDSVYCSDVKTFEFCVNHENERYARDRNHVYYPINGCSFLDGDYFDLEEYEPEMIIKDADPETFKYIGYGFAIDKNSMYYKGEAIQENDSIVAILGTEYKSMLENNFRGVEYGDMFDYGEYLYKLYTVKSKNDNPHEWP